MMCGLVGSLPFEGSGIRTINSKSTSGVIGSNGAVVYKIGLKPLLVLCFRRPAEFTV